ncbi:unnamed protein product [Clonostachys rosea]|uniref:Arylamine N-acetyltransferase n=1 Tax=Bionectria ochroleuca TaxID=29856 RepID=A0ABY6UBC0_BIOOC|nr:unnamed protein product [Clonostachys rosea]
MSGRITYTKAQLDQYFTRVNLPPSKWLYDVSKHDGSFQKAYLELLLKHQLTSVPFENVSLHYSTHRVININAKHLVDKILLQPGRGGYCMENNTLFHTVLLSIGFDVYLVGGRVFENGRLGGMAHCLNIVTIDGERYAVDVGYGPNEPIHPLKIVDREIQPHIGPASVRLRFDAVPGGLKRDQKVWIFELRQTDESEWVPCYCFTDMEFLPEDFAVMNHWPQKDPRSIFVQKLLCVRFTSEGQTFPNLDEALSKEPWSNAATTGQKVNGTLILVGDNFKWRVDGVKVFEKQLSSEEERIMVLERYFGMRLTESEKEAIKGTATALPLP